MFVGGAPFSQICESPIQPNFKHIYLTNQDIIPKTQIVFYAQELLLSISSNGIGIILKTRVE
jgi:hypothetical protein